MTDRQDIVERARRACDDMIGNFEGELDGWAGILSEATAEIEALRKRVRELEGEAAARREPKPHWYYLGDDQSSDRCRFSVWECIDEDWLYDNEGKGEHVVEITTARPSDTIWAHVRFFSDAEKDARESDDDYEITEYPSEEAARQSLNKGS